MGNNKEVELHNSFCLNGKMEKFISIYFLMISFALIMISCFDSVSTEQEITTESLLSAPETIIVAGNQIKLETNVYLNLKPNVEPNPMIVKVYIETVDSSDIPSMISVESIYVVKEDSVVWKHSFSSDEKVVSDLRPFRIIKIARNGPHWGPFITVDVIVKIKINKNTILLRASDQNICAAN